MNLDKTEVMKERDSLLEHILYKIQNSPVSSENLIIRGGAALHFFYSSPRYSSDIDAVSSEFGKYKNDIKKELIDNIDFEGKTYFPSLSKETEELLRVSYRQEILNTPTSKLEIDSTGNVKKYKKTEGKFSPLLVEEPSEIYSDKIVATFRRMHLRDSIKHSDLFDLDYIANSLNAKASKDEIREKFKIYMDYGLDKKILDKILFYIADKKNHEKFRRDLEKSMISDFFKTQKFDSEYFEKKTDHFESLKDLFDNQKNLF